MRIDYSRLPKTFLAAYLVGRSDAEAELMAALLHQRAVIQTAIDAIEKLTWIRDPNLTDAEAAPESGKVEQ